MYNKIQTVSTFGSQKSDLDSPGIVLLDFFRLSLTGTMHSPFKVKQASSIYWSWPPSVESTSMPQLTVLNVGVLASITPKYSKQFIIFF